MHVVFTIRRPPLRRPRPVMDNNPTLAFGFWSLRPRTVIRGDGEEYRIPLHRRVMFSGAFFRVGRRWEWYLPAVVTVWHRDPETDGTDSSCRNHYRARRQGAIKTHRYLAAAWWDFWWRHYDLVHVHHWTIQVDAAQELRRWALTRCETCGGRHKRGRSVNFHVVVDQAAEDRRREKLSFRERWLTGERNLHHHDCANVASLRATKASLAGWLRSYGHDESAMRMQREREPYYGCYAWWRELILGEPSEVAELLAAAHVQRSVHPCPGCEGRGNVPRPIETTLRPRPLVMDDCSRCEGTGHERVADPVPAELV
jgi:hypothetical protein